MSETVVVFKVERHCKSLLADHSFLFHFEASV